MPVLLAKSYLAEDLLQWLLGAGVNQWVSSRDSDLLTGRYCGVVLWLILGASFFTFDCAMSRRLTSYQVSESVSQSQAI